MSSDEILTYCLNVHPAESWAEVRAALLGPAREVAREVGGQVPFPVGLRLSARAVEDLKDAAALADLKAILAGEGFEAVTVNGFPYGPFHGTRVKEAVYRPDWREPERLAYTCALADLMAEIAPPGRMVSLSTVPGAFRPLGEGAEDAIADALLQAAAHCARLERRTGVPVALAVEPEPFCLLETVEETARFFRDRLYGEAAAERLAALAGLSPEEAERALPRHLGLCYDVCHAAVEFEDPRESLALLREAGVPVHKLQISAALRVPRVDEAARAALARFEEPTYLHQVVARGRSGLRRLRDLPEALARGSEADGEEWRVHFHVPVFLRDLGAFESTQGFLEEILALHRERPISPHLEVETYTWDVLPPELRAGGLTHAIGEELRWVRQRLAA